MTGGWRPYDSRPEVIEARLRQERNERSAVENIRWRSQNPDAVPVGYQRPAVPPQPVRQPAPSAPVARPAVPRIVNLARKPEPEPVPQPPRRSSRSSRQPRPPRPSRQPRHLSGEAMASIDGYPIWATAAEVERLAREAVEDL